MQDNVSAFRDYLQKEKNYSPHTVTAYLDDIGFFSDYLKKEYDTDRLEEVGYAQVRSWIVSLVDGGISNSSVNRKISSLKSFYKFLLKIKQITASPLLKHKSLKTPK
ncbi:MAG TPA: site-specific integrase, partial [Flavobacterium sp.]